MTTRAIALLTIPLFALFLLVRMPAAMVYERMLAEKLPPHVEVERMTGSLWNGRAHGIQVHGHRLGDVGWSLEAIGVLRPSVHLAFDARSDLQSRVTGRVMLASLDGGFTLRDIKGTTQAAMLEIALREVPAKLAGAIELDLVQVEVAPIKPYLGSADGSAVWTAAAVLEPMPVDLGTVVLQMSPSQGRAVSGSLRSSGGDVAVDDDFRLDAGGQYQLDLTARAEAQAGDKLDAILQFGKPNSDGSRQFSLSGRL